MGDLNIVPTAMDISHPAGNTQVSGFTKPERDRFSRIVTKGDLIDAWRHFNPVDPTYQANDNTVFHGMLDLYGRNYSWRNVPASFPGVVSMESCC